MDEGLVDVGGQESWVGVPVHQCVDLQLGIFKCVRRRILHLLVDHLSHPGIQTHLFGRQNGNVVLVNGARFLLNGALVDFLFEVFAGEPEQHILLTVLRPKKLPENIPTCRISHELVEGLRPEPDLLH